MDRPHLKTQVGCYLSHPPFPKVFAKGFRILVHHGRGSVPLERQCLTPANKRDRAKVKSHAGCLSSHLSPLVNFPFSSPAGSKRTSSLMNFSLRCLYASSSSGDFPFPLNIQFIEYVRSVEWGFLEFNRGPQSAKLRL